MPFSPVPDSSRRVRRAYFDYRYGQLHLHQAIPAGGGFDEATSLLCIPGSGGLGSFFRPLLLPLALTLRSMRPICRAV